MAYLGQTQYTSAIGPMPVTGDPMKSDVITSALVGIATAAVVNPVIGVAAFASWMAFGPKTKKRPKPQTQGG